MTEESESAVVADEPQPEAESPPEPDVADDVVPAGDEPETEVDSSAYTKLEQAHYQAIREKEREVAGLESEHLSAKERASAAKKRFEAADEELRSMIRKGPDPQLPLPGMEDATEPEKGIAEDWRELGVDALGIPAATAAKLAEADIGTLGALSDTMNEYGTTWFNGIGGVGGTNAIRIEDAFADFWRDHPEYTAPVAEPDEESTPTAGDTDGTDNPES